MAFPLRPLDSDDSYTPSPEPQTSKPCSFLDLPKEVRLGIIKLRLRNLVKAVFVPTAMTRNKITENGYIKPLLSSEQTLICATTEKFARTCKQLRSDYAEVICSKPLFACQIPRLVVHVLDFDFSFAISELFSRFTDATRQFFEAPSHRIWIRLTITRSFALMPNDIGLQQWLLWREQEEAAGREIEVDYEFSDFSTKGENELEELRYFLLLFNSEDGESAEIVRAMTKFYLKCDRDRQRADEDHLDDMDLEALYDSEEDDGNQENDGSREDRDAEDEERYVQDEEGVEDEEGAEVDDARGDCEVSGDGDDPEDDGLVRDNYLLGPEDFVEDNDSEESDGSEEADGPDYDSTLEDH